MFYGVATLIYFSGDSLWEVAKKESKKLKALREEKGGMIMPDITHPQGHQVAASS